MKTHGVRFLAAVCGLALAMASQAQAQLSNNDRLLLFYNNFYQTPRSVRQLQQQQTQLNSNFRRFENASTQRFQSQERTVDRVLQESRMPATRPAPAPTPPIYSGQAAQRQYFMRMHFFNPPRVN